MQCYKTEDNVLFCIVYDSNISTWAVPKQCLCFYFPLLMLQFIWATYTNNWLDSQVKRTMYVMQGSCAEQEALPSLTQLKSSHKLCLSCGHRTPPLEVRDAPAPWHVREAGCCPAAPGKMCCCWALPRAVRGGTSQAGVPALRGGRGCSLFQAALHTYTMYWAWPIDLAVIVIWHVGFLRNWLIYARREIRCCICSGSVGDLAREMLGNEC